MLLFDWSSLLGKNNQKKINRKHRICVARVFCSTVRPAFLFSERGAERDFLINNVGVELLPSASLSLSRLLSPSLIAASKYQ